MAWRHVVVFVPERDVVRVAFFVLLPRQRTGVARGIEGISAKCREPSCRGQWEEGFNMCSSVVRVCSHHAFAGGTESLLCFEGTGAVVAWRHVVVFVPERGVVRVAFFVVLPEHRQRRH